MSETKEPYKTYYAYQAYPCELEEIGKCPHSGVTIVKNVYAPEVSMTLHTHLFDTLEEARNYADDRGEFDFVHDDDMPDKEAEIIFEVNESELLDYLPIIWMNGNQKDLCAA